MPAWSSNICFSFGTFCSLWFVEIYYFSAIKSHKKYLGICRNIHKGGLKMTKKFLAITGIVCAVGLIIALIGFAMVGFDFVKLDLDEDYTEKVFTVSDSEISLLR